MKVKLNDINSPRITEEVLSALMFVDITEDSFRKYISSVELKPYEKSLTKLNKMKIKVMIETGILPYSDSFWNEMDSMASEFRVLFAEKNKEVFIASLDNIEIKNEEINRLLQSELFAPEEKEKILSKPDITTLGIDTAKIISGLTFIVERAYTDAAWSVLEESDKYALLLNQIDTYENEELSDLFAELAPVYHQFIERTRHKFKLAYTDYNKQLLDKLVQKGYITSAEEEWIDKDECTIFNREREHVITRYVKQLRT